MVLHDSLRRCGVQKPGKLVEAFEKGEFDDLDWGRVLMSRLRLRVISRIQSRVSRASSECAVADPHLCICDLCDCRG